MQKLNLLAEGGFLIIENVTPKEIVSDVGQFIQSLPEVDVKISKADSGEGMYEVFNALSEISLDELIDGFKPYEKAVYISPDFMQDVRDLEAFSLLSSGAFVLIDTRATGKKATALLRMNKLSTDEKDLPRAQVRALRASLILNLKEQAGEELTLQQRAFLALQQETFIRIMDSSLGIQKLKNGNLSASVRAPLHHQSGIVSVPVVKQAIDH